MIVSRRFAARLREIAPTFVTFAAVGVVGFAIDAGLLLLLLGLSFHPLTARPFSFAAAVFATFELNRRWTFKHSKGSYWHQFIAYLSVQGIGFLTNVAVYSLSYLLLPPPYNAAIVCIAIASAIALFVNFVGARVGVFRRGDAGGLRASAGQYTASGD